MKRFLTLILVTLIVIPAYVAAAENLRLAVVDVQEVIDGVEEGKQAKNNLENEKKLKEKALEDKKMQYTKMEQDMEKQRLILSQEALMEKQKQLGEKMREIQSAYLAANDELNKKYNDSLMQIYRRIESVVTKLAKENDYSMVLEKGEGRGVMFSKSPFDITAKVIQTYNEVYGGTKGAAKK